MFKKKILEICSQRLRELDHGNYQTMFDEGVLKRANETNIAEKEMIYKIFERLLEEEPYEINLTKEEDKEDE